MSDNLINFIFLCFIAISCIYTVRLLPSIGNKSKNLSKFDIEYHTAFLSIISEKTNTNFNFSKYYYIFKTEQVELENYSVVGNIIIPIFPYKKGYIFLYKFRFFKYIENKIFDRYRTKKLIQMYTNIILYNRPNNCLKTAFQSLLPGSTFSKSIVHTEFHVIDADLESYLEKVSSDDPVLFKHKTNKFYILIF